MTLIVAVATGNYAVHASDRYVSVQKTQTFTDRPAGRDRSAFVGTLDQVLDDVRTAADELIVDLNLQDWFTSTRQMLETAVEIRERAAAA
jgi:hypothetical protein